ncbi:zinc-binding dehydrogenase [Streptomyces sp. NPDC091279]|uniref:zinc-binding dehydrogenase n=1 Tax=Streptomyces sp. NPDC091279 TaxID=3365983 RepID=UPI0037F9191A
MRAVVLHGPRNVRVEEVPDPVLVEEGDAVVRVVAAAVCGSDLWTYRGIAPSAGPARFGHEFVGTVEAVGPAVHTLRIGDFVIAPFNVSCRNCRNGVHTSCGRIAHWGVSEPSRQVMDAGQGEMVRVPLADGTLVATPGPPSPDQIPSLLALCDVMATGHHAARITRIGPGETVVVVGDGAVGLCAVLAARAAGAESIIVMSRHPARQAIAQDFGAADIVALRGKEGIHEVRDRLRGPADVALECVGTDLSLRQAIGTVRPGGRLGCVGLPLGITEFPYREVFARNLSVTAGSAPARAYLPELIKEVWSGAIAPGRVFDAAFSLERAADAYAAMDSRRVVKALLRP